MKAIISCNYDPKYLFCLPIVTWGWNRLGVGVVVIMPYEKTSNVNRLYNVVFDEMVRITEGGDVVNMMYNIQPPTQNAEVTYTQCSRLYAAAISSIRNPEEILVTSDVDMLVFERPPNFKSDDYFTVFGHDIVPEKQYPMCYIAANAKTWDNAFVKGRTMQECLDDLLGNIDVENMRGNYWAKDQEEAFKVISKYGDRVLVNRAKGETKFAAARCDRDDWFWAERIVTDGRFFDAHLWRPLYTEENIEKLLGLWSMMYPLESRDWIKTYAEKFNNALI